MRSTQRKQQQGFLLVTVVAVLAVLAAIAMLLSTSTSMDNAVLARQDDTAALDYVTEAGLAHASWQLAQSGSCTNHAGLPATPFGPHSYAVTVSPTSGSPVTLTSTGTLPSGATRTRTRDNVGVYQAPTTTTLQPGAAGKDTYIRDGANDSRNFGAATSLKINNASAEEASLLQFDLSGIPAGSAIVSANLELWLAGAQGLSNGNIDVHRVTRDWVEGSLDGQAPVPGTGATYNSYNGQNNWTNPGGDYAPTPLDTVTIPTLAQGWKQWDLTSVTQNWLDGTVPNYGVLLRASSGYVDKIWFGSGDGNAAESPKMTITYGCACGAACAIVSGTIDVPVISGNDDVEEDTSDGDMYLDSSDLELAIATEPTDLVGMRFVNLEIPPGASISNAYLQFQVDEATTSSTNLVVRAQAADNAGTFSASNYDLSSRPLSTAAVNWSPVGWPVIGERGENQRTPDLSAVIQEIVDRPGWASGNALVIVVDGSGTRIAESYEGDPAGAATLHVEYGGGSGEPPVTQKVLFVVGNVSMTAAEQAHKALLESWGYSVELIDDGAAQSAFNAAVAGSDLVFLTNDVTASSVGSKLVGATIGVVTSEDNLSDEFGISSSVAWDSGTTVTINDNSHYITAPFSTGSLTIFTSAESMGYLSGSLAPGLQNLASSSSGFGIVALEAGAALYSSGTAAGRRVQLPWGGNGFDPGRLTADGLTILRRALEWGAGATSPLTGPLAHWKFDETSGSIAADSVGGHDGTLVNGTLWANGVLGGAVAFDGVDDYVDLTSDTALDNVFDGGATVTAWINPATWGESNYARILDKDDSLTAPGNGWAIELDGPNRWLLLQQGFTTAGGEWAIPQDALALNKWQHVGIVYDSSSAANDPMIYIDGVAQAVTERRTPSGVRTSDDSLGLRLGNYSLATSRTFRGSIDDVRIHDRMLDGTEIAALAVSGGGGGGGSCTGSFRDEFNNESYSGSDGDQSWSTNWLEINESDGWDSGDERVVDTDSDFHLQIRDNDGGGEGVQREANLSAFTSAIFSFEYRRDGFDDNNDYVTIEVSANGGASWTLLESIGGSGTDSSYIAKNYDISAHIASNTRVRFLTSPNLGSGDEFYVDDVEIAVSGCAN